MFNFKNKLIVSCLTGIVSMTAITTLQLNNLDRKEKQNNLETYTKQEQAQKVKANFQKKMPGFGYDNLIADWTYLQFIQYFGDGEARQVTGYSVVTDYFEAIVQRDPRFLNAHFSISSANSLFAVQPQKTIELIDTVLEAVSPETPGYPFFLWTYKATDEILFLGDLNAAKESYQTAAEWAASRNDELGDELSARFLQTANFLATNPDPTKAQIGAWMTVLSSAQDRKTYEYVIEKLESLGAKISMSDDGKLIVEPPKEV